MALGNAIEQAGARLRPAHAAYGALAFSAVAFAVAPQTFVSLLLTYTLKRYYLAVPLLLIYGLLMASVVMAPKAPLTFLRQKIRSRWRGVLIATACFILGAAAFSTLKHVTPEYVSFFADAALADLDAALHFGDPWRALHAVTPDLAEPFLFYLYGPVWFVQMVGVFLVAAFMERSEDRARYFLSFLLMAVVLGVLFRIAGSSAGPIFYDRMFGGSRFTDLTSALAASPWGQGMLATADYLYASYSSDRTVFGTGIAAMPSLHVADAMLNALLLSRINRALRLWGWFYFAVVCFGSVYFGWHYAVDAYVSILAMLVVWWMAGRLTAEDPAGTH